MLKEKQSSSSENDSDTEPEKETTDDKLFKSCGGRTAHKYVLYKVSKTASVPITKLCCLYSIARMKGKEQYL